jgi:16S rRNA (uracil1498-N3)-methyltransferase
MRRFFLSPHAPSGNLVVLTGPEARHIASVLRFKPGQAIELFDGQGAVHTAVLQAVEKNRVIAAITATRRETTETASPLTLAQCLLKGKKMDFLVQKATELGVAAFLPVISRYCENHGDRAHQEERWRRIMLEACKQSHRATPMAILPVTPLDRIDCASSLHRFAAWEEERHAALPTGFVGQPGPVCLLLGPEGGLHADDLQVLRQWQFTTFSLGPRILRGETAALAVMAIVQYLAGGLQPPAAAVAP